MGARRLASPKWSGFGGFPGFFAAAPLCRALNGIFWGDFNGHFGAAEKGCLFWRYTSSNLYYRGRRHVAAVACLTGSCFELESAALIAHFAQSSFLTARGLPLMSC